MATGLGAAFASAAAAVMYAQQNDPLPPLALPTLDPSRLLRVVYGHNPRFERPTALYLANVLARTKVLCKLHLRLDLGFSEVAEESIGSLFRGINAETEAHIRRQAFNPKDTQADRQSLVAATLQSLSLGGTSSIDAQIAYARPYLVSKIVPTNAQTLAEALTDTHIARYLQWLEVKTPDGKALLDGSVYSESSAWTMAGRKAPWTFDVLITNQLITSIEHNSSSVHSALRGGVINGITTESFYARYSTVSVLSLFPMNSQDPLSRSLRRDIGGQTTDAVEAAATVLTHELGHQLLHLGHPFGRSACVMNPAQLLQFEAWAQGLDAAECPVGSPDNASVPGLFSKVDP